MLKEQAFESSLVVEMNVTAVSCFRETFICYGCCLAVFERKEKEISAVCFLEYSKAYSPFISSRHRNSETQHRKGKKQHSSDNEGSEVSQTPEVNK